jgi:hypothetical protein
MAAFDAQSCRKSGATQRLYSLRHSVVYLVTTLDRLKVLTKIRQSCACVTTYR